MVSRECCAGAAGAPRWQCFCRHADEPAIHRGEEVRRGRQLHRVRTIGHQQDHLDPADLHRGQRAFADRDRPAGRPADLHRAPADLRAGVLAAAGADRGRSVPGRPAAAHDRHRGRLSRPASPSAHRACWRTCPRPPGAGSGSACCRISRSPTSRSSPVRGRPRRSPPAATLPAHPTALGRALLAFSSARTVELTIMRGLRRLHRRRPSPRRTASAARWR